MSFTHKILNRTVITKSGHYILPFAFMYANNMMDSINPFVYYSNLCCHYLIEIFLVIHHLYLDNFVTKVGLPCSV